MDAGEGIVRKTTIVVLYSLQILGVIPSARAAFQQGDILLNLFGGPLQQYRADGTVVNSYTGPGSAWEGATPIGNDKLVTTRRSPTPGINIFDTNGNISTFNLEAGTTPGDVSVFSDGTLAISDQNGRVLFYSQAGAFIKSVTHPDFSSRSPFGSAVASDDTLWIAAPDKPFPNSSALYHFSSDGSFLGKMELPFTAYEVAIDPTDGTFWLPKFSGATLYNFSSNGLELSHFTTLIGHGFISVAASNDGTVFVSGSGESSIYHYSRSGELLGSFSVGTPGRPLFMNIVTVPEPSTSLLAIIAIGSFLPVRRKVRHATSEL